MITIVQGTLGGGKTCRVVRMMLEHLAKGLYVYTNIDFVFAECRNYCRAFYGVEIQRKQLIRLPIMEEVKDWVDFIEWGTEDQPVLCAIDESGLFWNARDWANTQKHQADMLSFLRQSRKAGVDVIFITQFAGDVDKQFRELAQLLVNCRNFGEIKDPIFRMNLIGLFRYQIIEISHHGVQRDVVIDAQWWWALGKNKMAFACYRTHAFLDSYMSRLAESKVRLPAVRLRRTHDLRALAHSLGKSDALDRFFARILRRYIAAQLRKSRKARPLPSEQREANGLPNLAERPGPANDAIAQTLPTGSALDATFAEFTFEI